MTPAERLSQINLKIERAKEHVINLHHQVRGFISTDPYKVGTNRDAQTRELAYYITHTEPIPRSFSLIAGDALHNLRSALDHLAFQIIDADTGGSPINVTSISFPVYDSLAKYEAGKRGKIQGMHADSIAAIDALKPYAGGNDLLWALHKLNNTDKHRLLLAVGASYAGFNIVRDLIPEMVLAGTPADIVERFKGFAVFVAPDSGQFPLQAGFELFRSTPDAEYNPDHQFAFSIAFGEPGVFHGKPLVQSLHKLVDLVEGIVAALSPRLGC